MIEVYEMETKYYIESNYKKIRVSFDHMGRENLLIFDTLPGVIACPNILTFVFTSPIVSVFPFIIFSLPNLNSKQLSFSALILPKSFTLGESVSVYATEIFGLSAVPYYYEICCLK